MPYLPKPDKTKKSIPSDSDNSGQLSEIDKIKKKRTILIILISLTIGLSLTFSLYHFFKTTSLSLPKFSAPPISISADPLEKQLQSILKSGYSRWSFTVQSNSSPPFFWSSSANTSPINFPSVSLTIEKLKQPVDTFVFASLPQGLKIMELATPTRYQFIIITPQDQIYVDINSPPDNPQLSDQIKTILPIMYWSAVKH